MCLGSDVLDMSCDSILGFNPVQVDTATSATRGTRYIWLEEDVIKGLVDLGANFGDWHNNLCVL